MPAPKRPPIQKIAIKDGGGNLTRKNQLSREAQKEIPKRTSRNLKKLK